jgi:hypothetical protein
MFDPLSLSAGVIPRLVLAACLAVALWLGVWWALAT